jgi:hypothetical protein
MKRKFILSALLLIVTGQILVTFLFAGCRTVPEYNKPTLPPEEVPVVPQSSPEPEGKITVFSSCATVDYPYALQFTIDLKSPAEIINAELEYRILKICTVEYTSSVLAKFTPAEEVRPCVELDMLEHGGLPPGADIEYTWKIEDKEGRSLETEPAIVRFDDLRYDWENMTEGIIELYWYEGERTFAEELMNAAKNALFMLAEDTGTELLRPARLYIYANTTELKDAMVYPQEWMGGVAYIEYGITAIGISPDNLDWGKRTIAHELTHLLVYQMTYNPYGMIPLWLNEGLAMYAEGEFEPDAQNILDNAVRRDNLVSVDKLIDSFPPDGRIRLCYAESYSLVKFLIDTYGQEKMLELLEVFKQGDQYDDALTRVYGFDMDGLEDAWRTSLGL